MIITIARQHGSNGHEIARQLAEKLGCPCYDKEIVHQAALSSGFSKEILDTYDERRVSPYISAIPHFGEINEGFKLNMQVVSAQFDAIRRLAAEGDCIFVGRCADYLLRNRDDLIRVFIMGKTETRVKTLAERKNISEEKAAKLLKEVDKDRSSYYRYYTDRNWGELENYELCIDSSIGIEASADVIAEYVRKKLTVASV